MRRVASVAASIMIAAALLALAGSSAAALAAMARANDRVNEARELVVRLTELREVVAEEAIAEAGFRRSPGDGAWHRLEAAMAAVPPKIAEVRERIGGTEGLTLSRLAVLNARYVEQVRARREGLSSPATDDRVAGPALDSMVELLKATIGRHRANAQEATDRQETLIQRLQVLLPVVFATAFGVLAWAHRLNVRDRRRLRAEANVHREEALTDALTGLANRNALTAVLRRELARDDVDAALLFVDLDRFKEINDTWGHQAGDLVLQQAAQRLLAATRDEDVAARLGGDEFVVLLRNACDADLVARRILAAFDQPFDADGHLVVVGTSIGIAESALVGRDPVRLLAAADAAMYDAKRSGRGRIGSRSA